MLIYNSHTIVEHFYILVILQPELQISQCVRETLGEVLDFLKDIHGINNLRVSQFKSRHNSDISMQPYCNLQMDTNPGFMFNDDTLGGGIKAGLAQFAAFELVRELYRDSLALQRYLPWLLSQTVGVQGYHELTSLSN